MKDKDQFLEQILKEMREDKIVKPDDLAARTIERMHIAASSRLKRLAAATRNIGIVVAACILLFVGVFSAMASMHWWQDKNGMDSLGMEVDLSSDYRIREVREQLPFELALPSWLPKGYHLTKVQTASLEFGEEAAVSLQFSGPPGAEPILITQSFKFELDFRHDLQFVQFGSADSGYWIGSNATGWGAGTRSDLGYYCENKLEDIVAERTLIFINSAGSQYTYVSIYSGVPLTESRNRQEIPNTDIIFNIAKGIAGVDKVGIVKPGKKLEELTRNWALIKPTYVPDGFRFLAMNLEANIYRRPIDYSGSWVYSDGEEVHKEIVVQQWNVDQVPAPARGAQIIELEAKYCSVPGWYEVEEGMGKLTFYFLGETNRMIEISAPVSPVDKEEIIAIGQSLADQNHRRPLPTQELVQLRVSSASRLSFGPNWRVVVHGFPGTEAELWVDDEPRQLPGAPGEYSPVWWRGDKFAYQVYNPTDAAETFYVYDTRDDNYELIKGLDSWTPGKRNPIMLDGDTVAVLAPDGIWKCSLSRGNWERILEVDDFQATEDIAWSPDTSKVAWKAAGDSKQLVVLDIATGKQIVVETEGILDFAWSESNLLAIVTSETSGVIWDGEKLSEIYINHYLGNLSWVPGKDIFAYEDIGGIALTEPQENGVRVLAGYSTYAWLSNGDLAVVTDSHEEMSEITIFGWR